jgi:16S rRNA (guanine(527)-N(7))-methyltransferase RsmG
MPAFLPALSLDEFRRQLAAGSPEALSESTVEALHRHYQELARWNRSLSLVGPGTVGEVVARHYGEALAALPLIPARARAAVDLGSGAGFPGLVLAAARPDLEMTLIEAREKKWSFLLAASRRAELPCRCLNVRVALPLPAGVPEELDLVTVRALRLEPPVFAALAGRLSASGRVLMWVGDDEPQLPAGLRKAGEIRLAGSDRRRVLSLLPDDHGPGRPAGPDLIR